MKYEYSIETLSFELTAGHLNNIGKEGWELCSVIFRPEGLGEYVYYFKRRLYPDKQLG